MKYLLILFIGYASVILGQDTVLIIGHRGCRGLLPENSIVSFQHALALGVDGIELDVVVNKDKKLVISHEPYFQSSFCLDSSRQSIKNEKAYNFYEMTQDEIRLFDCGSIGHPKFPEQQMLHTTKPLFSEYVDQVDMNGKSLLFEVKSNPNEYGKSQPFPNEYVSIILEEIDLINDSVDLIIMSFDQNILEELYKLKKDLRLVYLTYLPIKGIKSFLNDLTFKPYALGMYFRTIKRSKIQHLQEEDVKVFGWTVNDENVALDLIREGIDLLITDYPDRLLKAVGRSN